MATARIVFFFPNGAVAVLDQEGQQMCDWQRNLFCDHLRTMRDQGVVTGDTPVEWAPGPTTVRNKIGD